MDLDAINLYDLIHPNNPERVLGELRNLMLRLFPNTSMDFVTLAFNDTVRIFRGEYPGFRECTTLYHDLEHTLSVLLASIRLFHGAVLDNEPLFPLDFEKLVTSALFHDVGLIQTADDTEGTGAKYTIGHEERSIAFLSEYLEQHHFSPEDVKDCAHVISCTSLNQRLQDVNFRSWEAMTLGRMLGASDLLAQMADRAYLEKLLLLYREFQEAGVPGFDSEFQLLEKTEDFYISVIDRLEEEYFGVSSWMRLHFAKRWDVDKDMYKESMDNNMEYLREILHESREAYSSRLRRAGIVKKLKRASL